VSSLLITKLKVFILKLLSRVDKVLETKSVKAATTNSGYFVRLYLDIWVSLPQQPCQ